MKYAIHEKKHFPGSAAFYLMDERGLPIDVIIEEAAERGMVVNWEDFFTVAKRSKNFGRKKSLDKLYERVKFYCENVYTDIWWQKWIKKEPGNYKEIEE